MKNALVDAYNHDFLVPMKLRRWPVQKEMCRLRNISMISFRTSHLRSVVSERVSVSYEINECPIRKNDVVKMKNPLQHLPKDVKNPYICKIYKRTEEMLGIPQDPMILFSYINMKLRDDYSSLDALCDDLDINRSDIETKLATIGFEYNQAQNKFW